MTQLGFRETLGIDNHFLEQSDARHVIALETLRTQLEALSSLTDDDARLFVDDALTEFESGGRRLLALMTAWQSGDAFGLQRLLEAQTQEAKLSVRIQRAIIDQRNLPETIGQNESQFPVSHFFISLHRG